jgi:hypothetical protein
VTTRYARRMSAAVVLLTFSTLALGAGAVSAHDGAHASRGLSEAARLAGAIPLGTGQTVSLSGSFHIIYGDAPSASGVPAVSGYVVIDDQGHATELLLDESTLRAFGGARALNHQRVLVVGQEAVVPLPGVQGALPLVAVHTLQLDAPQPKAAAAAPQAVSGPQPWATILCRFADSTGATPNPLAFFQNLILGTTPPGLDHYWRELSYNNVNLTGSEVHGWYNLPQPRSYYVYGSPPQLDFGRAANDCTAVADAAVTFPNFVGINLMFNTDLDGFAWGGSWFLTRDGVPKTYRMTWVPPWGYQNQGPIAHEMGHGFGLPHSSGPYGATYDSRWDVMSDIWDNCPPFDPTYRCVGVHTIAYHKDILGWIPSAQKYVAAPGTSQTIMIERLGQPTTGNFLMAQLPISGSSTQFYTVEVRRFAGYDVNVPAEAVVLHRVNTTRSDRDAQVVDTDGNGNPSDAGAMWLPGETFVDSANGFTVAVIAQIGNGFQVAITNGTVPPSTTTFVDVPTTHPFFTWIEALVKAGITAGCSTSPPQFCPESGVTRDQMAVFLLRGSHGAGYTPPTATGAMFADVPWSQQFASWIEQLAREGITGGCATSPLQYCPGAGVTRDQMAVFLLRAKYGAGYTPPAPIGMFADVPVGYWAAAWIEQLAREGITSGCGGTNFCPGQAVTRGQMAVFLVKTFGLAL